MRVALKVSAFILFTFLMSLRLTTSLLQKLSIKTCRTCLKSSFSSSPYSLLMDTPIVIRGFVDIADRYDLFLFDQFGVLHDGASPIKGTIELLDQLEKLKKTVVIVSNTSGRSNFTTKRLNTLGFPTSSFDGGVVTSGDAAYKWIENLCQKQGRKKCCFITWKESKGYSAYDDTSFLSPLDVELSSVEEADFIFFHGSQAIASPVGSSVSTGTPISLYEDGKVEGLLEETLRIAVKRGIPALCANLDLMAIVPTGISYMPGILKKLYEEMGGDCIGFGKPNKEYFDSAVQMASVAHRKKYSIGDNVKLRAIHVGDSVHHDIKGANSARLDSILITSDGVHKDELQESRIPQAAVDCSSDFLITDTEVMTDRKPLEKSLLSKVCDLCSREEIAAPTFILEHCKY